MALIVEDGTGKPDADSFAGLAEAAVYLASIGDTRWTATGVDDPKREIALRQATAYIRDKYALQWQGFAAKIDQALSFPRFDVYDAEDRLISSEIVPRAVFESTCDLASRALVDELEPDVAAGDAPLISKSVSVGPISSSKTFAQATDTTKAYTSTERKLRPLLKPRSSLARG